MKPGTLFKLVGACAAGGLLISSTAGCSDPLSVGPAIFDNEVDTVTIFALQGTGIQDPSALDLVTRSLIRTDRGAEFDLAFDIDSSGTPLLFPAGAFGFDPEPGMQPTSESFGAILRAPESGYDNESPLALTEGQVFVARSRLSSLNCSILAEIARFAKFRVLDIDLERRTVSLETLMNVNCGFRGLEPGLPTS